MADIHIKLKELHWGQEQVKREAKRFNVLKCGRRWGKTDLSHMLVARPLINGQRVGFWYPNYKDGKDVWQSIKNILYPVIAKKDEQLRQLTTITGGVLDMWSLEDPDAGRGFKYHRAIIDEAEKARHLKKAWEEAIRATLVDYRGDAWFMSTPKFGDTYFKSTLFKNELKFDNWKSWRFRSADNPHLPAGELEEVKATLDPLVYRCEYEAEDVDIVNNPWAWAFDYKKHVAAHDIPTDPAQYLYLSFDFNKNPITCAVIQHIDETIYVIEQIKLANSDIYQLCNVIKAKYPNYIYFITGDATGQNKSAMVKDNMTYYRIIQGQLAINPTQFRLPSVNPRLEDNQVLVNSLLSNYPVRISPEKGKALIWDLQNCSLNADGSIIKGDRNDPAQQWDALDCLRYYCNTWHSGFIKKV